jgi:hypothetical protein
MKALALNCTLKRSPEESNTAALARVVLDTLAGQGWTSWNKGPGPATRST